MNEKDAKIEQLRLESNQILSHLTGKEITEEQRELAYVRISELNDQMAQYAKMGDVPVYIVNLLPKHHRFVMPGAASYQIMKKPANAEYGVTEIRGCGARMDTGRGGVARGNGQGWAVKTDPVYWAAQQIANDIFRYINGDLPPLQHVDVNESDRIEKTQGIFISPTRVPSPELLAKHRAILDIYMAALVEEGNHIFRETGNMRTINGLSRQACDYLGVSTAWHKSLALQEFCAGCGAEIRKGIARCPSCGAVRDWDKAFSLGLLDGNQQKLYHERRKQVA